MWAGRNGWRSIRLSNLPAGPVPDTKCQYQFRTHICITLEKVLTIIRNGIRRRPQAVEVIPSLGICLELAAQVKLHLLGILLLVQTIRRGLPDFHIRADKGLLRLKVNYPAVHEGHLAAIFGLSNDNIGTVLAVGCVSAEERA